MEFKGHADQHYGYLSYSQHGEDILLVNLFKLIGIENPSYLDIGAHHPINISNTALLYSRGSRGINIDANPELMKLFNEHRPLDTNICVGISSSHGVKTFFMYDELSGLNSIVPGQVESASGKRPSKQMRITVTTLDSIVHSYCNGKYPDLLCTDIEGMDFEILSRADFEKSRPKIICTESKKDESERIKAILELFGFFCYCRTGENLIFIEKEYRQLVY